METNRRRTERNRISLFYDEAGKLRRRPNGKPLNTNGVVLYEGPTMPRIYRTADVFCFDAAGRSVDCITVRACSKADAIRKARAEDPVQWRAVGASARRVRIVWR